MWFGPENNPKEILLKLSQYFNSAFVKNSILSQYFNSAFCNEFNEENCIVFCGAIVSYKKLQSAGYLLDISC